MLSTSRESSATWAHVLSALPSAKVQRDSWQSCLEWWGGQIKVLGACWRLWSDGQNWESNSFWRHDFNAPKTMQSLLNLFKDYLSLTCLIWSCAGLREDTEVQMQNFRDKS